MGLLQVWKISVHAAAAGEGLAEVVGQGVGGADGLPSGLNLDGAIAADRPVCASVHLLTASAASGSAHDEAELEALKAAAR